MALGPPTSTGLRDLAQNGGGAIKYMAAFLAAVAGGGYLCFINHEVIVWNDELQWSGFAVALLLIGEVLAAVVLVASARGATHRLLTRRVRVHKTVAVATSSAVHVRPRRFNARRPSYFQLLCSEAVRHTLQAFSAPVLAMVFLSVFLRIRGYNAMESDIFTAIICWLPIMTVLLTARQLARWFSGLSALRMLPWQTRHIATFMLAGAVSTGLVAALVALLLSQVLGVPVQPGWFLLLIWVPVLGYLLSPRTGAGVLAGVALLAGFYAWGAFTAGSAMLAWGVALVVILPCAYRRTRQLIASSTFYRQRQIAFLGEDERG